MEHHCKVLEQEGADNIEQTIRIATSLTRQTTIQQALLRQALGYIMQLEAELALRDADCIAAEEAQA